MISLSSNLANTRFPVLYSFNANIIYIIRKIIVLPRNNKKDFTIYLRQSKDSLKLI